MYWLSLKGDAKYGTLKNDGPPNRLPPSPLRMRKSLDATDRKRSPTIVSRGCSPDFAGPGEHDLGHYSTMTKAYMLRLAANYEERRRSLAADYVERRRSRSQDATRSPCASKEQSATQNYPRSVTPDRSQLTHSAPLDGHSNCRGKVPLSGLNHEDPNGDGGGLAGLWIRSRQPQRPEEFLRMTDPAPFYDWGSAWDRLYRKNRSTSPWSREKSKRTVPLQWDYRIVPLRGDARVDGPSMNGGVAAAVSAHALQANPSVNVRGSRFARASKAPAAIPVSRLARAEPEYSAPEVTLGRQAFIQRAEGGRCRSISSDQLRRSVFTAPLWRMPERANVNLRGRSTSPGRNRFSF